MWVTHLTISGVLILLALPVLAADQILLRPSGGPLPVDLRGLAIQSYAVWLVAHIAISSVLVLLLRPERIAVLHGFALPVSAVAAVLVFMAAGEMQNRRDRAAREARDALRQGLGDTLVLENWSYWPDAAAPVEIRARISTVHAGRFAAGVTGQDADGQTVFAGEPAQQVQLAANSRHDLVMPLTVYGDGRAASVQFSLYLFRDEGPEGAAPIDIVKYYRPAPPTADDGARFYAPLPEPGGP